MSPRFLSRDERIALADGLHAGHSVKTIAATIGRSYQSVYREIVRNRRPDGRYQPWWAHNQALLRRRRPKRHRIESTTELRRVIRAKLDEDWSRNRSHASWIAPIRNSPNRLSEASVHLAAVGQRHGRVLLGA